MAGCISRCGLVTRAQAVSAGLGGNIAALTMQRGLAWAPQLGNTSCLPPLPEHAQPALKAHFVPGLLHQVFCCLCFPHSLPASQHCCSSTAASCPVLPCVSHKNHHICNAFYSCSHTAPPLHVLLSIHMRLLPSLASSSISCALFSPQQSCPQSQWRSTEPVFGD